MERSVARVGAWAGAISVVGIFGYHLALMAVAGQRVSGITDATLITAYYKDPAIAVLGAEQFLVVIPVAVFAVALRETLSTTTWARFLAMIGLVAITAELATVLTVSAAQAALVVAARDGGDVAPLFRFWDSLYNSGLYALEATWVAAFGLATREASGFPRWLAGLSILTSALLAINISAIWVGIPDPATLVSALLLVIWFASASLGLARTARLPVVALGAAMGVDA